VSLPPPTGSLTTVENLGTFPASRAAAGLGWNITLGNEFEFKAVHDAGGTRGRIQCSWVAVEQQSAPPSNTSKGYELPADCTQALAWAKKYGLELTFVGAFGPPYHSVLTLTLDSAAAAGATSLPVTYASGVGGDTLATLAFPYDYVNDGTNTPISPKHSYAGTLISAIKLTDATHGTLTLASALNSSLPSGTTLDIEEVLYPSPSTNSEADPSVQAYAHYVEYIGSQCAAAGVPCDIELWNEPPWGDECWDLRADCFDTNPGYDEPPNGQDWGFVAALQSTKPMAGVSYTWAGPNKTGDGSVLKSLMKQYSGVAYAQPNAAVTTESLHPYGSDPEDLAWNEPCLLENLGTGDNFYACNLFPSGGSNMVEAVALTLQAQETNPAYGIRHAITETGISSTIGADEAHKARFVLRQYLAFLADDVDYIEYYRLYDQSSTGASGFGFIEPTTGLGYEPLTNFKALAGLVSDLATIKGAPVATYAADGTGLTAVASYRGTYPLDLVQLVGSRSGDTVNSEMVGVFQRSFGPGPCAADGSVPCWATQAPPALGQATLTLPSALKVTKAVNLTTRAAVPFNAVGHQVTLDLSDDPIELLLTP
jgi:hypothetical protein